MTDAEAVEKAARKVSEKFKEFADTSERAKDHRSAIRFRTIENAFDYFANQVFDNSLKP